MSTLGSLMALLSDPGIQPYNAQELTENRLRLGNVTNQTELLRLAELKRQQEAEALVRAQVQNDPRVREMLFGGGGMPQSLLGSLQAPAPPPGALTQSPMPGMPGQAQSIPAYPDASRYASVPPASGGPIPPELAQQMLPQVTRPQSTLGGIGAQPQANPLLEMASRNPDAALLLQKQMLQQEDTRYKIQERQLDWRSKQAGYIGSTLQGATDQASYDTARDEIARVFPEWGARLPATYSKEALQPFIDRALSVKEKALLDSETLKTQVDLFKARTTAAGQQIVPKYTGDAQRDSLIASEMQRRGLTGNPPQEVLDLVEARIERGKKEVSASHGTGQIVQTPQGYVRIKPGTNEVEQIQPPGGGPLYPKPTEAEQRAQSFGDRASEAHRNAIALEDQGLTPSVWQKVGEALPFGMGNYLQSDQRQQYRQAVSQFAQALLRKESGAAISPREYDMTDKTYFPQPGDSKAVIAQKRAARESIITSLQAEGQQTGRQPARGGQRSQGPLKPVSEMSTDELRAERDRLRAQGGR